MARVALTQSAQTDLLEAWLYIAEENQQAADRMLDAIDGASTARTG
jgi:toxin ParE1/3/4